MMEFLWHFVPLSQGTAKRRLSLETPNDPKRHNGGKNGKYA